MTNVSDYPITVDGIRLDTLAKGIEATTRTLGAVRGTDTLLAGLDGVVASTNDPRDPSTLALSMFVRGTDDDGLVPLGRDAQAVYQENLDALLHLFGKSGTLLDVRMVMDADNTPGADRQAYAKVQDSIAPEDHPGDVGRLSVVLTIPSVTWRSLTPETWSQAAVVTGTTYEVTTLAGSSGPVDDAVITLAGPFDTGTKVVDPATGAFVRLNEAVAAGNVWRVNVDTWESRVGAGLTVDSADTAGTDKAGVTDQGGGYPRLLRLNPRLDAGARKVKVQVVGTGFTAATTISTKTRRAYL